MKHYLRGDACLLRSWFFMQKLSFIVIIRNRFFVNNSNPEPIIVKSYVVMGIQISFFPLTLGDLSQGRPKWPPKKTNFLPGRQLSSPKCCFSATDLREIWRQYVNRCRHVFSENNCQTVPKRSFVSVYRQTD